MNIIEILMIFIMADTKQLTLALTLPLLLVICRPLLKILVYLSYSYIVSL